MLCHFNSFSQCKLNQTQLPLTSQAGISLFLTRLRKIESRERKRFLICHDGNSLSSFSLFSYVFVLSDNDSETNHRHTKHVFNLERNTNTHVNNP